MSLGQNILGVNVPDPRLTTLASIAKSFRIHPMTLLNVFQVAGVDSNVAGGSAIVNYREVAALVKAAANAMPVSRVPYFLNTSRSMVAALIELQLLTRIQDHNVLQSKIGKAIDGRSIPSAFAAT